MSVICTYCHMSQFMCEGLYLDIDGVFGKDNDNGSLSIGKMSKTVLLLVFFLRVLIVIGYKRIVE